MFNDLAFVTNYALFAFSNATKAFSFEPPRTATMGKCLARTGRACSQFGVFLFLDREFDGTSSDRNLTLETEEAFLDDFEMSFMLIDVSGMYDPVVVGIEVLCARVCARVRCYAVLENSKHGKAE
jgi:hypothetical protein